jgi:hypothetical protein
VLGTPDEARAQIRRYEEAGIERSMLRRRSPWDRTSTAGRELIGQA